LPKPKEQAWALRWLQKASLLLLTSAVNIFEAGWLVNNPEGFMRLVVEGDYKLALDFEAETEALYALMKKYPERMDLGDAAIVRLSELHPRATVLTVDETDFRIYRRFRNESIPCDFRQSSGDLKMQAAGSRWS
jgi:uncharacterized protein